VAAESSEDAVHATARASLNLTAETETRIKVANDHGSRWREQEQVKLERVAVSHPAARTRVESRADEKVKPLITVRTHFAKRTDTVKLGEDWDEAQVIEALSKHWGLDQNRPREMNVSIGGYAAMFGVSVDCDYWLKYADEKESPPAESVIKVTAHFEGQTATVELQEDWNEAQVTEALSRHWGLDAESRKELGMTAEGYAVTFGVSTDREYWLSVKRTGDTTDSTLEAPVRNFLTSDTPDIQPSSVPDAQPLSNTTSQQAAEAREQAERVQQVVDNPPRPRQNFLEGSTPEIGTQESVAGTTEETQDSITDTPYSSTRVGYEGRVLHVGYTEDEGADEIHQRARVLFGIPASLETTIDMVDQCAQSETEPNWLLRKRPETNEELVDWISAPAGAAQWGPEAAARMRKTMAEQERERLYQAGGHAEEIRAAARRNHWKMYGAGVDPNDMHVKLDVGYEGGERSTLAVLGSISKEVLVAAIAERCGVVSDEELELEIEGVGPGRFVISGEARYTVRRKRQQSRETMYGPNIDRAFSRTTLNVGFEDKQRRSLEVRTDIDEETLMTAIAEMYGVEGEMQLDIQGGAAVGGWFDVSSTAKYTLYRVEAILKIWPKYLLRPHTIRAPRRELVPIVICYGMRGNEVTVPPDTTRGKMIEELVCHFGVGGGEWTVEVEDSARNRQDEFRIAPEWRYVLEPARRPTVQVSMRYGKQERTCEVPEGTSEIGMKQLLESGFGVDVRKKWRMVSWTPLKREAPYELKRNWTYELREWVPERDLESFRVMANTMFGGLRADIEIETGWSERQVHEACWNEWHRELHPSPDAITPVTKVVTFDERGQRVPFEARENWTYELRVKPPLPRWVCEEKLARGPKPTQPNELVMIGLQLEDGTRLEREVKRGMGEHGLKLLAWGLFDWPPGPLHLHVVNSRDEAESTFKIEHQWTYVLRSKPMEVRRASERPGEQTARPTQKDTRTKGQGVLKMGAKRHITAWCGTKTLNLSVSETTTKNGLIEEIVSKMGEPKGSYTMEIKDRGGALRTEFRIAEGWSYVIYRTSPPGTPEAADQTLRRYGNETRELLNRSSETAMREEELRRGDAVRRNSTVLLWYTMDGERRQSVEVRGSTKAEELTVLIMEKYGMTGWGYLTVLWGGKPGSFSLSESAEYRVSSRMTPSHCARGCRAGRNAARFTAFERRSEEEEEGRRFGTEARTADLEAGWTSRVTVDLSSEDAE
jgi:hypothetical protein